MVTTVERLKSRCQHSKGVMEERAELANKVNKPGVAVAWQQKAKNLSNLIDKSFPPSCGRGVISKYSLSACHGNDKYL